MFSCSVVAETEKSCTWPRSHAKKKQFVLCSIKIKVHAECYLMAVLRAEMFKALINIPCGRGQKFLTSELRLVKATELNVHVAFFFFFSRRFRSCQISLAVLFASFFISDTPE